MLLKSLEIRGFKSFPDKTVLTFGQGITAVVGPNGSGKSNLSDAIRWVLGEQSSKSLRGSKMEDVVFNGTQGRSSVGFAEVSLTIDNTSRRLDFDADEVRVTRRYYRSGDSEYLINGAMVRLKDVQMLFMDTGLGRDGYSMIGQGRISDIVASKSEDRREIFEEAAGIAKYRYRKTEAERRLQSTEDNLLRLRDIVQELEERVGPLEQQANKAKKFLTYAEEKKTLEIGVWLHTLSRSREVLRDFDSKLELARTRYDEATARIDEIEREIERIGQSAALLSVQMDERRRAAAGLEEEAVRLESDIAVRQNDIEHNLETVSRLEADREQSETGSLQLLEEMDTRRTDIAGREAQIAQAEADRVSLAEQLEELSRSSDEVGSRLDEWNRQSSALALELSEWRVREGTADSSLSEITLRLSQLHAASVQRAGQTEQTTAELEECRRAARACDETVESLQNTVNGYLLRAQSRRKKRDDAKELADKKRLDAEEKRRRVRLLEELERSLEGFSGSVKAVMKQADRGALRGIHGPVAGLLEVKRAYALAIETALGAAAQNLVCDTETDAKRGIAYLKETNGGRATFLPLSAVRGNPLREQGLESEPGFVGLASSLASADPVYTPILDNLLGRTAVAEDLDAAVALAKKYSYRFRVVTLDGQVVNAGGSLTGGSHVKGAGLLSRRSEIERLQQDVAALAAEAEQAAAAYRTAEQDLAAVEAALTGAQGELSTAQEDAIRLSGELRRLTELSDSQRQAAEESARETESLTARAEECRREKAAAAEKTAAVLQQQSALESELTALTGGRQELSGKREQLSEQMAAKKLDILAFQKEIEALHAAIASLQQRREDGSGYREQLSRQIEALHAQNAAIEEQIAALRQSAADRRTQAKETLSSIAQLVEQRNAGEQQATALRRQSREQLEEKERLSGETARIEEKSAAAARETDEIVRKLYEEYELTPTEAEAVAEVPADVPAATRRLQELRSKIRALGSVNVEAIEEYREVSERYAFLSDQVKDVEVSKAELLTLIGDLTTQMRELFLDRFKQINYHFGTVFAELFSGGKADLQLTDPDDILRTGIEIHVQPPGKVILNLDALSGGEKVLVAIALLFAILKVTPSPFCVLDEIEAALDDVNVDRFAQYLRRMCGDTQFIVITHRRGTMEEADVLYGVTMQEQGVTKLLELRASEVEEKLGMKLGRHGG